ncbi:MAG: hypothetical protein J1G01_01390 [Clostridiales bacterium]|nr:hypothetical protein [Clostridiales bacterium]
MDTQNKIPKDVFDNGAAELTGINHSNILENDFEELGKSLYTSAESIHGIFSKIGQFELNENAWFQNTAKTICKTALDVFLNLVKHRDPNPRFSVSAVFKKKINGQDGYAMPYVFSGNGQGISCDTCGEEAKTKMVDNRKYIDSNAGKASRHHGVSFSERFIEQIKTNQNSNIISHTNNFELGEDKSHIFLINKDEIAELFDVGNYESYPQTGHALHFRSQVALFPIEFGPGKNKQRIGYMQVTSYYNQDNAEDTSLISTTNSLDDKTRKMFQFFANWLRFAHEIASVQSAKVERSTTIKFI